MGQGRSLAPLLSASCTSCILGNSQISWEAHDLSPRGMWRKVQCLQNVKSCQISIGRSVLTNIVFVRNEEEMARVESDHFQGLVPRKEVSITALLLKDSFGVSGPGRQSWPSPGTQAMLLIIAQVVRVILLACE